MFQPYLLFIASRYLLTRRQNRFASFVSVVSVVGIALGVAALVIVLSVMNGFEREVTRHILGMSSHAVMRSAGGVIADWQRIIDASISKHGVIALAPYVRGNAMLTRHDNVRGVIVEGIVPELETGVTDLGSYVSARELARLQVGSNAVLIGRKLAEELAVGVGDSLTLVVPDWNDKGVAIAPRYARVRIDGLFHVGMHQYDSRLVLMHLGDAQSLLRVGDAASGLRVRFERAANAPIGIRQLARELDEDLGVVDWTQYHRNFFLALESQKRIMFIILVLIIAVAAFNIAANMIMAVAEKIRDIAILRTLGATRRHVVTLFLLQGLMIGVSGALLGGAIGAWGAHESEAIARAIETLLGVDLINADVYFIDYLPAELHALDVFQVALASVALSLLATLYPAYRAASVDPAEAVHRD